MLVVGCGHLFLSLNKSTKLMLWHNQQNARAKNDQVTIITALHAQIPSDAKH